MHEKLWLAFKNPFVQPLCSRCENNCVGAIVERGFSTDDDCMDGTKVVRISSARAPPMEMVVRSRKNTIISYRLKNRLQLSDMISHFICSFEVVSMALFECPERIIVMREQQMSPFTGFSSLSHKTHALSISNQTLGLRVRAQLILSPGFNVARSSTWSAGKWASTGRNINWCIRWWM